ncbi:MAG: hypothetical protein ACC700_14795 [Anaerolineales bacterium]
MRSSFILFFLAVTLAACTSSPSEDTIQTAIAETDVAQSTEVPAPTTTPIPAADIDLAVSLIAPESLGLSAGQIRRSRPPIWPLRDTTDGVNHLSQELVDAQGESIGWVSISLFDLADQAQEAFSAFEVTVRDEADYEGREVQEGAITGTKSLAYDGTNVRAAVGFALCRSFAHIFLGVESRSDLPTAIEYARGLSARLEPLVCP